MILKMHNIEPYYRWRDLYQAEHDENSPFFGKIYNEFEFTDSIYGYCIHPQWDYIGSETLFIKILFVDYNNNAAIIECIGEWNDTLHNDIMHLKRNIIDDLLLLNINKFILIGENVFNFHGSDDEYYAEWFDDVEDGFISAIGFSDVVKNEWKNYNIDYFIDYGYNLDDWRIYNPIKLIQLVEKQFYARINA